MPRAPRNTTSEKTASAFFHIDPVLKQIKVKIEIGGEESLECSGVLKDLLFVAQYLLKALIAS